MDRRRKCDMCHIQTVTWTKTGRITLCEGCKEKMSKPIITRLIAPNANS